jgi:hypothetical protein
MALLAALEAFLVADFVFGGAGHDVFATPGHR